MEAIPLINNSTTVDVDVLLNSIYASWWEDNGFIYNTNTFSWIRQFSKTKHIMYADRIDTLSITNWDDYKQYRSQCPTYNEFKIALNLCKLNEQFNNTN